MLGDVGRCWAMLGDVGRCWAMLGDAGRCWAMLGDAGQCWTMLGDAGPLLVYKLWLDVVRLLTSVKHSALSNISLVFVFNGP
jgi:hypothetical protein